MMTRRSSKLRTPAGFVRNTVLITRRRAGGRKTGCGLIRSFAASLGALVVSAALAPGANIAAAQSSSFGSRPSTGSTFGRPAGQSAAISPSQDVNLLRHRDALGRVCLQISGYSRAHTINPKLFDHVVSATNNCAQIIHVSVCYTGSQHCVQMDVPGHGRKEVLLGILPAIDQFNFDFHERFSPR
jgi:hypothetical protein